MDHKPRRNGNTFVPSWPVYIERYYALGRIRSTSACGLGMTWTDMSSPTRRAAAAPASVAALTAPTSPRTSTVTYPAPMYSLPTRTTFAAFTIASAASTEPMRPRVSTIPSASDAIGQWGDSIIRLQMPKIFAYFFVALLTCAAAAACAREEGDAKAIATPAVTLSRSDAAVGTPVDFTYRFTVAPDAPPFAEDYIVFVHFVDADREQ